MNERIKKALDAAEREFWAVFAEQFPESRTGDLDALVSASLRRAMALAGESWVWSNVPVERMEPR